jgi:hypothetical protein
MRTMGAADDESQADMDNTPAKIKDVAAALRARSMRHQT